MVQLDDRGYVDAIPAVVGRDGELAAVSRFLDSAASGPSALVLEGEAGIGKTAVWRQGVAIARERLLWTLVARPGEAEARLGYAALGDLFGAVPEEAASGLAEPQRRAVDIALLRIEAEGTHADARAVSLGVLNILRSLAAMGPVLVAIDDVQWLDTASARSLQFAIRRL